MGADRDISGVPRVLLFWPKGHGQSKAVQPQVLSCDMELSPCGVFLRGRRSVRKYIVLYVFRGTGGFFAATVLIGFSMALTAFLL